MNNLLQGTKEYIYSYILTLGYVNFLGLSLSAADFPDRFPSLFSLLLQGDPSADFP